MKEEARKSERLVNEIYVSLDIFVAILLLLRQVRIIAVVIGETALAVQVSGPFLGCQPPSPHESTATRSSRIFMDSVVAILLIMGAISVMGTLFFNKRLVFLIGGPIFQMDAQRVKGPSRFPHAPKALYQEWIRPMIRFFNPS